MINLRDNNKYDINIFFYLSYGAYINILVQMSKERTIDYTIKDHDTFQGRKGTMKKYFQKSSSAFQFIGAA